MKFFVSTAFFMNFLCPFQSTMYKTMYKSMSLYKKSRQKQDLGIKPRAFLFCRPSFTRRSCRCLLKTGVLTSLLYFPYFLYFFYSLYFPDFFNFPYFLSFPYFLYFFYFPYFPKYSLFSRTDVENHSHHDPDDEADIGFFSQRAVKHRDRNQ